MFKLSKILIILSCFLFATCASAKTPDASNPKPMQTTSTNQHPPTSNSISVKQSQLQSNINIPFNQVENAAVFLRGNKLWVIFPIYKKFDYNSKPLIPNLSLLSQMNYWIKSIQQLNLDSINTYLVFDLAKNISKSPFIKVSKNNDGWSIQLSKSKLAAKSNIPILSKPDANPYPTVIIDVGQEIDLIDYTDPYVGDHILAIPTSTDNKAVNSQYSFINFKVLPSIQGVVIERISEDPLYNIKGDKLYVGFAGMPISKPVLNQSSTKNKLQDLIKKDSAHHSKILGLKFFEVPDKDFGYEIYVINQELQNVAPQTKPKVYADLALLYLANRLYKEAQVIIKIINKLDPQYANTYKIRFMEALAAFMDRDYNHAFNVISQINISNTPVHSRNEIRLWQGIIAYMSDNSSDYFISNDIGYLFQNMKFNFLSGYTPDIIIRLAEVTANEKLNTGHLKIAEKIIKSALNITPIKPRQQNRLDYLAGRYYLMQNNEELADKYLKKCIADVSDPLNRTLCRFQKIKYQLSHSQIDKQNAIKQLEDLSYIWKGDKLQVNILEKLGDLYDDQDDSLKALKAWHRIIKGFPNSMQALKIREKMVKTFVKFFFEKKNEQLKPLAALAIFYQYHNLIPLGETGDKIILQFTDYLVHFDLLGKAIAILNFQVNNRFIGIKREEAINKVAKLNLLNQHPGAALEALNLADPNFPLPDYVANERKHLKARALYLLHNYKQALELLHGDQSPASDEIQADIYWAQDNWRKFNDHSEPYLYSIENQNSMLTHDQVVRVAKQAVSYIMMHRRDLLNQLYNKFKDRIPKGPYASVLKLLNDGLLANHYGVITQKDITNYKTIVANLVNAP